MADRKYQTIDPLIMETLNLNQKRIHHIFDILHGRDPRPETDRVNRTATINSNASNKLPRINMEHQRVKSPKFQQQQKPINKRQRNYSASVLSSAVSKSQLQNIEQYAVQKKPVPRSSRPSKEHNLSTLDPRPSQPAQQINLQEKRERLMQDYGMHKIRNSKSMQINPKDVYRIEIQNLVSKPIDIEEMQDAEKLMRRLKRRYQHLRKFDKGYYSRLCSNQIQLL